MQKLLTSVLTLAFFSLTLVGCGLPDPAGDNNLDAINANNEGTLLEKAAEAMNNTVEGAEDLVDGAVDAAGDVVDAAEDNLEGATDAAGDVVEGAVDAVQATSDAIADDLDGQAIIIVD